MKSPQNNPHRKRLKIGLARRLRRDMTESERKLWSDLRGKRFGGLRFRRQQPIGPYIVDFYCPAAGLVIEPDGGHHNEKARRLYNETRTRWLESEGFHVLRIANCELSSKRELALEWIWHQIEASGCVLPQRTVAGPLPEAPQR
ncbi:MAG: endonuclease domain-containing protein [Alphaproteobacteria bacterium]|nr:endonuclease domain-containing protein [Alphaproteobacteria bacterium]